MISVDAIDRLYDAAEQLHDSLFRCVISLRKSKLAQSALRRWGRYGIESLGCDAPPDVVRELFPGFVFNGAVRDEDVRTHCQENYWPFDEPMSGDFWSNYVDQMHSDLLNLRLEFLSFRKLLTRSVRRAIDRSYSETISFGIDLGPRTVRSSTYIDVLYNSAKEILNYLANKQTREVLPIGYFGDLLEELPLFTVWNASEVLAGLENERQQAIQVVSNLDEMPRHQRIQFARDAFAYARRLQPNSTWAGILDELNQNKFGWPKLADESGVRSAVVRHAKKYGLPLPPEGKGGRPKGT